MPRRSDAVAIDDPVQYHRARAALAQRGLLTQFMDPSGNAQLVTLGRQHAGWLWIDQTRLDEAEEVLDELGIPNPINSRPIVDRRDPACPECSGDLDPNGPENCPGCGLEFMWVEIDESATEL